ncbi:hypothetical protein FraEuI1c_1362 [Pseudofrankia inefficax]|uniref:Uncharacterized protein n=1 Tax=Pseudofrankia inefficax (strain DSM 45817 / CECT 9037 / DDB 130130 / EuI1c) TaxID=298654 RepID=E3J4X8_PSEI1|nr:hypothetical protein FraEuI1c_1362 [Pseudofrankia inefficax]
MRRIPCYPEPADLLRTLAHDVPLDGWGGPT